MTRDHRCWLPILNRSRNIANRKRKLNLRAQKRKIIYGNNFTICALGWWRGVAKGENWCGSHVCSLFMRYVAVPTCAVAYAIFSRDNSICSEIYTLGSSADCWQYDYSFPLRSQICIIVVNCNIKYRQLYVYHIVCLLTFLSRSHRVAVIKVEKRFLAYSFQLFSNCSSSFFINEPWQMQSTLLE